MLYNVALVSAYNIMNQLYVYIDPLSLEPPYPQVITEHPAELPVLHSSFPLAEMMWMNLEPVTESEVRKRKTIFRGMHVYGI